jgi:hypothetical protein
MTRQKLLALTSAALLAASSTIAFAQGTGGGSGSGSGAAGATSGGGAEGPGGTAGSNAGTAGTGTTSGAQGGQVGNTGQNKPDCMPGAKSQTTASQQQQTKDGKVAC